MVPAVCACVWANISGTKCIYRATLNCCRYVFDPVDVEAELEVTSRVRKAAAEALMEAEAKLRAAEEVQAGLQQQLEEARQLQEVKSWLGVRLALKISSLSGCFEWQLADGCFEHLGHALLSVRLPIVNKSPPLNP